MSGGEKLASNMWTGSQTQSFSQTTCPCEPTTPPESKTPVDLIPVWEKAVDKHLPLANRIYEIRNDWICEIPIIEKEKNNLPGTVSEMATPRAIGGRVGSLRLYDDKNYARIEFKTFIQYISQEKSSELKKKYISKLEECNTNILEDAGLLN